MPTLIWTGCFLIVCTSVTFAGACSEDGLRYFTKHGVSKAHVRFHELLEEARCRKEPEFLVNLAQMYKSKSNDSANACRALIAYQDALQSPNLSAPYPRVARKGVRAVGPACQSFAANQIGVDEVFYQIMRKARRLDAEGRVHYALREYRLLIHVRPNDSRPINGFCKTARRSGDRRSVMFCEEKRQSLAHYAEPPASNTATSPWAWTTASLSLALAGVAVWQGVVLYDNYQLAWDAHEASRKASVMPDGEALVAEQNRILDSASNAARRAEKMMWISGGLSVGLAITTSMLWASDDTDSSVGITGSGLLYKAAF